MPQRKLWPGAPGSIVEPPSAPVGTDKDEHPEATINGKHWSWESGQTDGIPEEALAVWQRAREANS